MNDICVETNQMPSVVPGPNLLLIGAPKCGTTSLLLWLRKHPEVYHPWRKYHSGAWESRFLISGPLELPISPQRPRGTLQLPHEIDMDHYRGQRWIIDKSPQHLYFSRALESVRDLSPEARVIITLRDPYDLMISLYSQIRKSVEYDTTFESLFNMMQSQDWVADKNNAETWSFLTYPRYSHFVRSWVDEIGADRVRVIPLSSISQNSRGVLQELSDWLGIDSTKMPRNLGVKNPRGQLSNSPFRKFLRKPPSWVYSAARVLLPSRALRKTLLDPIRRRGWKHVPTSAPEILPEVEKAIRERLSDDTAFFESLGSLLPSEVIIQ